MDGIGERFLCSARDQLIELPQERGKSLSGAGWSEDERVLATGNGRPSPLLRITRLAERLLEPLADERMKSCESGRTSRHDTARQMPGDRVLEHPPQLLRPPLEDLARQSTLPELVQLDLL